jgi:hypothetical protein
MRYRLLGLWEDDILRAETLLSLVEID